MRNFSDEKGLTLIELLTVVSLLSITMIAIMRPLTSNQDIFESGDRYAEVIQNALIGMDKVVRELKHSKDIIAVSDPESTEGFIEFVDRLDNNMRFQYTADNGYLEYGPPDALSELAGPVDSLIIKCYQEDGAVPTTIPNKVGVVEIFLNTYDSEGKVSPIPHTSKVRIRMDRGDSPYDIVDYAMYGKAGITIKNNAVVTSPDPANLPANVGCLTGLGWDKNGVTVEGNIISGGDLVLSNGSIAAQDVYVNGTVDIRNNALVEGNVNANGGLLWDPNSEIDNYVNLAPDAFIDPPGYTGDMVEGGVSPTKFFNPLPPPTTFSAGSGTLTINGSSTLPSGSYGSINMKNNSTLNLSSGRYFFNSFSALNNCTINMNLSGGGIQIFVVGNVSANSGMDVNLINGGANKVYAETHGNWTWDGDWSGTIFAPSDAPKGNITFSSAGINGALFAGNILSLQHPKATISYVPANSSLLPWINPIN